MSAAAANRGSLDRREAMAALVGAAASGWSASGCSVSGGSLGQSDGFEFRAEAAIRGAAEYLWSRQGSDGGWRSDVYGLLSGGESLTPFTLGSLLALPVGAASAPTGAVAAALSWLRSRIRRDGVVGMSDPSLPDYPNYSTAMSVGVMAQARPDGWRSEVERMVGWLRGQQFAEHNGWTPDDAAYGAWGMGGDPRTPPNAGHVDLSMTRHVLEALATAGVGGEDPALARATVFLDRCRNPDGGFSFSTVVPEANKAGAVDGRYRSYGTATADGIRALESYGGEADRGRIAAARQWLEAHHRDDAVPGFEHHPDRRWREGLRYYYAGSAAASLPTARRRSLAEALMALQRPDGSWSNAEPLVKEDDPLIATPMALRALGAA